MNVTLFANGVFADVIRLRRGHSGIVWALNPMTGIVIRVEMQAQEHRHTEEKAM